MENEEVIKVDQDDIDFEKMLSGEFDTQANSKQEEEEVVVADDYSSTEDTEQEEEGAEEVLESDENTVVTEEDGEEEDQTEQEEVVEEEEPTDEGVDSEEDIEDVTEDIKDDKETTAESIEEEVSKEVIDPITAPTIVDTLLNSLSDSEIVVQGRKVKVATDSETIIATQQRVVDLSDKVESFAHIRPFAKVIEENFLEKPERLGFALDLLNGDKEAIKQLLKDSNFDALDEDMDLDKINYKPSESKVESIGSINIADSFSIAKAGGFESKLSDMLGTWDDESIRNFSEDGGLREVITNAFRSGSMPGVLDRIANDGATDKVKPMAVPIGNQTLRFNDLTSHNKFRYAIAMINDEQKASAEKEEKLKVDLPKKEEPKVDTKKTVKQKEVAKKVTSQKRRKATSVSKRKAKPKPKKVVKPIDLEGEDFEAHFESLISGD